MTSETFFAPDPWLADDQAVYRICRD
jgi:hypothetical protein